MFKQSRIKIIAATMAALLLFLVIAIAVIYASSYNEILHENEEMLSQFSQRFFLRDKEEPPEGQSLPSGFDPAREGSLIPPDQIPGGNGPGDRWEDMARVFEVSTFYYVAVSDSGEVLAADSGNGSLYTEDELTELAKNLIERSSQKGRTEGLMYMISEKDGYDLVAFMDTSVIRDSMFTLLKNTFVAFGISVIVVFLLSLLLSKRIIAPLEANDARQKQFVSDAGHELKTPIAVMSANCELLSKDLGDNPWLENIKYENERMSLLVKELLDLSHAESGILQEETVDLSNLVVGETLPFEAIAFEQGLLLDTQVEDGIITRGNPGQLKQLTAILLDNAIEHAEGGKDILLQLHTDRKNAVLSVTNSGKEIPQEKQALLFERFYRIDEARTGEDNHYGLGLAIAKAITQAHGGTIGIACKDGKVTFSAVIPIKK